MGSALVLMRRPRHHVRLAVQCISCARTTAATTTTTLPLHTTGAATACVPLQLRIDALRRIGTGQKDQLRNAGRRGPVQELANIVRAAPVHNWRALLNYGHA